MKCVNSGQCVSIYSVLILEITSSMVITRIEILAILLDCPSLHFEGRKAYLLTDIEMRLRKGKATAYVCQYLILFYP